MEKILIASCNHDKIREYHQLLEPLNYEVCSLDQFPGLTDVQETGNSFEENAVLKAQAYAHLGLLTIGDDSGLEVAALNGLPGVHSRRFSDEATYEANNRLLLEKMNGVNQRQARFVCVIALCEPERGIMTFTGICDGEIALEMSQENAFGYDPLFFVPSYGKCFSQMTMIEKNRISHRGQATRKLLRYLQQTR
ncbi:MAG: RdgB/HAM1 family non-canonical purine NTP pyrophosphatase [Candidatus Izemoplasmatales bacterium]|nr:RdgB/HAM1 family non-canonical purine NTP pyrophosphatase [Candidatus Izemoplasmatales bacterium]